MDIDSINEEFHEGLNASITIYDIEWDTNVLLTVFGIPEWSVDAELYLMNWTKL